MKKPITLWTCTCERCQYEWVSRVENPVRCAKCRTQYWNTPRFLAPLVGIDREVARLERVALRKGLILHQSKSFLGEHSKKLYGLGFKLVREDTGETVAGGKNFSMSASDVSLYLLSHGGSASAMLR